MKIVFMGTPEFACTSLRAILRSRHTVAAVVTTPDRAQGRGLRLLPSAVKSAAIDAGLPVLQPDSLRDPAFIAALRGFDADIFIVVAFRILPEEVFSLPRSGTVNLHASLLPKYRGAAPIQWAIINGERETGVTTFFIRKTVDTGNIILQRRTPLGADTTAGELHDTLAEIGAGALIDTLDAIEAGRAPAMVQDDRLASPAPRIFRETAAIAWDRPADAVHNLVRAMNPAPVAWTTHAGTVLRLHRSARTRTAIDGPPGTVRIDGGSIEVACGEDAIRIIEIQQPGHKALSADAFLRGYRLADGDLLG